MNTCESCFVEDENGYPVISEYECSKCSSKHTLCAKCCVDTFFHNTDEISLTQLNMITKNKLICASCRDITAKTQRRTDCDHDGMWYHEDCRLELFIDREKYDIESTELKLIRTEMRNLRRKEWNFLGRCVL